MGTGGSTVLVVDDDPDILASISMLLEMEGYTVLTAPHGKGALEILAGGHPCAIVLDLMMPVMDGYALLEHLERDEKLRGIPVIVVSGMHELSMLRHTRAVLRKPIDPVALVAKVHEYCASR